MSSRRNRHDSQREATWAASDIRDDLPSEPGRTRHLRRFFGGGALNRRPPSPSPGVRFLQCFMIGTHGSNTTPAGVDRHAHHFYGLLLHCYAHCLLRRGRKELTRNECVASLELLVLARPARNAFHRSRTPPPPAEIGVHPNTRQSETFWLRSS